GRFHGWGGQLDAAADLVAQPAGDVAADQRADRLADGAVLDRALDVGELRIEPLGVADGEEEALRSREGDELVGFGEGERDRFFQEDVLAREQALLRHRMVGGLGRGADQDRVEIARPEELAGVGGGGGRARPGGDGFGPRPVDLGEVEISNQGGSPARLGPDRAAPAGADDADVDRLHGPSGPWAVRILPRRLRLALAALPRPDFGPAWPVVGK